MHHFDFAFGFFSYLIDWFGFSGSMEGSDLTSNIGTVPIQGKS